MENCTEFGQFTLSKIIKIVDTSCLISRLKCTEFDFGWGSAPDPAGVAYSAPPDPLSGLRGPTSKGREGKDGQGRERKGEERGKGRKGEGEREGGSQYNWKPPPPRRNPDYATESMSDTSNERSKSSEEYGTKTYLSYGDVTP